VRALEVAPPGQVPRHDVRHEPLRTLSDRNSIQLERALEAITKAAHTGKIGDGKIFVTAVEQALRIRTGESGSNAL
jgi:hypothetical protein